MLRNPTTVALLASFGLASQVLLGTAWCQQPIARSQPGHLDASVQQQSGADHVATDRTSRAAFAPGLRQARSDVPRVHRADSRALPHPKSSSAALPAKPESAARLSSASQKSDAPSSSKVGSVWNTTLALSFIVVLILVLARFLKNRGPASILGLPAEAIEVLGKRPIDRQQVIHLVRCGSRILVVGGSPNGLNTLAEITNPLEVDFLAGVCRRKERSSNMVQAFATLFQKHTTSNSHHRVNTPQQHRPSPEFESLERTVSPPLKEVST